MYWIAGPRAAAGSNPALLRLAATRSLGRRRAARGLLLFLAGLCLIRHGFDRSQDGSIKLRFPDRLRKLRLSRNMTQQELADSLRLARNTIAMYETGDCEPCHDLTHRIADIPGATTDYRDPQTTQPVRFSRLLLMGACERRWSA